MLLLGSLPPWWEKRKKNTRDGTNPAPLSHEPLLSYPDSPNGRVATAGECKYHPVLPVNYTTKKLIVRRGAHLKDARLPLDGPIVSTQMQKFGFFLTLQT